MRLYKFKDLTDARKHPHFLQIVMDQSIWCASPDSLNDAEEFRFRLDYTPSLRTLELLTRVVQQHRTTNFRSPELSARLALDNGRLEDIMVPIVNEAIANCRMSVGVTSFSEVSDDPELWARYGGDGNGACVEICVPDELIGQSYHAVSYVAEKVFHVDSFLESALVPDRIFETFRNMLLTKTQGRWRGEREVRFIGNRHSVNLKFDGRITEVTFGSNVPDATFAELSARIADHCRLRGIKISRLRR